MAWTLLRPMLFRLDAETAHELTLALLSRAPRLWAALARVGAGRPSSALVRSPFGVPLAGPIGLAAGLDKDGVAIPFWGGLGFGFVEVGTVTAEPQAGNPRPRLFRLPRDRALINRMGFNNRGSSDLAARLERLRSRGHWPDVPVGVNVGKSRATPLERAADDYVLSIQRLRGLADWFTINVSSPNTPGLRALQDRASLERLLPAVRDAAKGTPVLLKLAPDLAPDALGEAVELACEVGISGIIATNTTVRRDGLRHDGAESGGLSGAPLFPIARGAIGHVLHAADGRIPIVGVGGIETLEQAEELLDLGCAALQLYTALIYHGPGLPSALHRGLAQRLGTARASA